ncbi:MAG: hypothetical protein AAB706_01305 [Patescibacteria group bacterium]
MKKYLFIVLVIVGMLGMIPSRAFAYIAANIVVINNTGLDMVIEKVEGGNLKVVGKAVPGKEVVFGVRLDDLIILGHGRRSATYLVKTYHPGTDKFYGYGNSIMLIRERYRSTTYYSTTWTATTTIRGTSVRKRSSVGPRVYNHPPGWYGGGRQYNYGGSDTITLYIGDGVDPAPIIIHNEDINRATLSAEDDEGEDYQSY